MVEAGRRAGDPPRLVAGAGRASVELQWEPRWSDLDDIIASAWRWRTQRGTSLVERSQAQLQSV